MKKVNFTPKDDQVLTPNHAIADWIKPYNPLKCKRVPIEFLVDGIIARGQLTLIAGSAGSGKTMVTCSFFQDQSSKVFNIKPAKALFLTGADCPRAEITRRTQKIGKNDGFSAVDLPVDLDFSITNPEFYNELVCGIKSHGFEVIIFDSLADFAEGNLNDANVAKNVMKQFRALAEQTNTAIVLITHQNKFSRNTRTLQIEDIADSRIFGTKCDYGFVVRGLKDSVSGNKVLEIINLKQRSVKEREPIYVEIVDSDNSLYMKLVSKPIKVRKSTTKTLGNIAKAKQLRSEGKTYRQIAEILVVSTATVSKYLKS